MQNKPLVFSVRGHLKIPFLCFLHHLHYTTIHNTTHQKKTFCWIILSQGNFLKHGQTSARKGHIKLFSQTFIVQIKMTGEESQSSSTIKICPYFRVGYCKYKESCKHYHPKENCGEIKCSNKSCNKRHRKPWKFGERCIRKDSCEFLHEKKEEEKRKKIS